MNIFNKDTLDETLTSKINKSSLWSRIISGEENQLSSDVIIKGIVWVVMFIISFVALFIVFNDNFIKPKEIVVVNNKDQTDYYSTDTSSASLNSTNFSFNNYSNNSNTESADKNLSLPGSSNTALPLNENSTTEIKKVISNSSTSTNNSESNNNKNSTKATFSNPNIKSLITSSINNTKVDKQKTNDIVSSNSSSTSNIINNTNVKHLSKLNNTVTKVDYSKAWLVVIYSGSKEDLVKKKWQELNKKYPNLFVNKKPYFIKIDIPNKGVYYRISLGNLSTNKALPYFSSKDEAISYCKYLVNNKLSCFIMVTKKNVLGDLLFNQ